MRYLEGKAHTHEMRGGRNRLTVRDPHVELLLAGLNIDGENLDQARRFGKALWAARNQFDIARRSVGLFGVNRLSKSDANRALGIAMARMSEGGEA